MRRLGALVDGDYAHPFLFRDEGAAGLTIRRATPKGDPKRNQAEHEGGARSSGKKMLFLMA